MSLYNASPRDWRAFDRATGECDPNFYDTHCQGCDGELEHDKACLACMTPDEIAARARKTILETQAHTDEVADACRRIRRAVG